MTYEQMEIIVKALGVIVALIMTFVIKPYINSKISATEQAKLENYIKIAVRCAEQIFTQEQWAQKKEYVTNYIKSILGKLVNIELTDDELDNLIEGFVYEVKHNV